MALTRTMADALVSNLINVNAVVPGFIKTVRPSRIQKDREAELKRKIPTGRLGEIADVTGAVFFPVGDAAKYVSGQVLHVTGGVA